MFMKLSDGRVYCLPEGYEVDDRSLDAIRYVLNPTFTPEKVQQRAGGCQIVFCHTHPCCLCCISRHQDVATQE